MNLRTTAILLLIFAAIGAAWWITRGSTHAPADNPATTPANTPLIAEGLIRAEQVRAIQITRPGHVPVHLTNLRGRWRMTQPVAFDADAYTTAQLVQALLAFADLGEAQVDTGPGFGEITLHTDDHALVLTFGQRIGGGIAKLQVNQAPPRLVGDRIHTLLENLNPVDLLTKQLATPSPFITHAFTVTTPQGTTRLEQTRDRWAIDGDPAQPALNEHVPGYVDVTGYLNTPNATPITRFVPLPTAGLSAYGLDRPRVRVDYETDPPDSPDAPDARSTLLIGGPETLEATHYYAAYTREDETQPVVFVLPAAFSISLAQTTDHFRDPRLTRLLPTEIGHISVPGAWAATLTDLQGSLLAPTRPLRGDLATLRDTVTACLTATAHGYRLPAPAEAGWAEPITLRWSRTNHSKAQFVTVYRADTGLPELTGEDGTPYCLVVNAGETYGRLIPASIIDALLAIPDLELPEGMVDAGRVGLSLRRRACPDLGRDRAGISILLFLTQRREGAKKRQSARCFRINRIQDRILSSRQNRRLKRLLRFPLRLRASAPLREIQSVKFRSIRVYRWFQPAWLGAGSVRHLDMFSPHAEARRRRGKTTGGCLRISRSHLVILSKSKAQRASALFFAPSRLCVRSDPSVCISGFNPPSLGRTQSPPPLGAASHPSLCMSIGTPAFQPSRWCFAASLRSAESRRK